MSTARFVKNAVMLCFLNVCLSYEHCEYSWQRTLCIYIYIYIYIYLNVVAGCIRLRSVCVCCNLSLT